MGESLCGVWVDPDGRVRATVAAEGGKREDREYTLRPFAWLAEPPATEAPGISAEALKGEGAFRALAHAETVSAFEDFVRRMRGQAGCDVIRPFEAQYLVQTRSRLYRDLGFAQLRRCQLDIETGSSGGFSDPARPADRVLAIGLRLAGNNRILALAADTDEAERELLRALNAALAECDPDVIEGHNIFRFDLDYLRQRCRRHRVPCAWGRYGENAVFRNSRMKLAERWLEYPRCDLAGRAVIDTYFLVQLYDITAREMPSYGLKDAAIFFDVTRQGSGQRTYLKGAGEIADAFRQDRARFDAYLGDDLRETQGLADILLPTYFEQAREFPLLLQDAVLRGTTAKIDLLFLEAYYHARQACPMPPEVRPFEGGYTRSFRDGVYRRVLHFDVASLYPSLLLQIGLNPRSDTLGVFIPLLRSLRDYRLVYKQKARSAPTEEERAEAQARQTAFKILINSFYGYLGFSGARFGDGELAAEVTRRGRELLQALIDAFASHGGTILEADTDGIYLSSEKYYDDPDALLALVSSILPPGIELERDGRYPAMFCYKAKNYALYDGESVTLRGSAFRSRGIEPYLQKLTDAMIRYLLGLSPDSPVTLLEEYRKGIARREIPVTELARSESLSQNPDAYQALMTAGGKPRRPAAEAALQMNPRPRMGERVSYYITAGSKGRMSDWQRARPLELFDPAAAPYDPVYYTGKLDDWLERYGTFLGVPSAPVSTEVQGDLFGGP